MNEKTLSLLAAMFALLGGGILAFRLDSLLSEIRLCMGFLQAGILSLADGQGAVFGGLDTRLERADKISKRYVRAGLFCIIISFIAAAVSLCVQN